MPETLQALNILSAMITPAVLISACGTLIFSTSTRLARIVDRVRELSRTIEELSSAEHLDFPEERQIEVDRQIAIQTRRTHLVQRSLTGFYLALALFVGTTVLIGLGEIFKSLLWLPNILGIAGTLTLFYGCMMLIAETRLALRSVNSEMAFTLLLREKYQQRRRQAGVEKTHEAKGA